METEEFSIPFKAQDIRRGWLGILEYLEDGEFIPYRAWLQVEKDTAFEVLKEELKEGNIAHVPEYIDWVQRLIDEEKFLNRRERHFGREV